MTLMTALENLAADLVIGDAVELCLPPRLSPLATAPVHKAVAALAGWLGASPKLAIA